MSESGNRATFIMYDGHTYVSISVRGEKEMRRKWMNLRALSLHLPKHKMGEKRLYCIAPRSLPLILGMGL